MTLALLLLATVPFELPDIGPPPKPPERTARLIYTEEKFDLVGAFFGWWVAPQVGEMVPESKWDWNSVYMHQRWRDGAWEWVVFKPGYAHQENYRVYRWEKQ